MNDFTIGRKTCETVAPLELDREKGEPLRDPYRVLLVDFRNSGLLQSSCQFGNGFYQEDFEQFFSQLVCLIKLLIVLKCFN
jgi:hypothetical protein